MTGRSGFMKMRKPRKESFLLARGVLPRLKAMAQCTGFNQYREIEACMTSFPQRLISTARAARRRWVRCRHERRSQRSGELAFSACEVIGTRFRVMPGIRQHTHFDAQITGTLCQAAPALGVTTAVIGNCGFTIARPKPQAATYDPQCKKSGNVASPEEGIAWEFEFLIPCAIGQGGCSQHCRLHRPHSVRKRMGDDGLPAPATEVEIEQMQHRREAMEAGVGFASSTHPPTTAKALRCTRAGR